MQCVLSISPVLSVCALTGVMGSPPTTSSDLPGAHIATKRRELNAALDKKLATLRVLFASSTGLLLELEGGALWEGLVAMHSCKRWVALQDLCQLFYQVIIRFRNAIT